MICPNCLHQFSSIYEKEVLAAELLKLFGIDSKNRTYGSNDPYWSAALQGADYILKNFDRKMSP